MFVWETLVSDSFVGFIVLTCKLLLVALVSSSRYNSVPSFVVNCYILRLTRGSTKSRKFNDTQHFI